MNPEELFIKVLKITDENRYELSPDKIQQTLTSEINTIDLVRHARTEANLAQITNAFLNRFSIDSSNPIRIYKSLLIIHQLMLQGPANITSHFRSNLRQQINDSVVNFAESASIIHLKSIEHLIVQESKKIETLFVRFDLLNAIVIILREIGVPSEIHKDLINCMLIIDSIGTEYSVLNEFELNENHKEQIKNNMQTNKAICEAFKEMIDQDQYDKNSIFVYFPNLKSPLSNRKLLDYFSAFGKVKRCYPFADKIHAVIIFEDSHVKDKWIQRKKYKIEENTFLIYENTKTKNKNPDEIQPIQDNGLTQQSVLNPIDVRPTVNETESVKSNNFKNLKALWEDKSRPLSPMGEPSSSVGNKIIEEAVHEKNQSILKDVTKKAGKKITNSDSPGITIGEQSLVTQSTLTKTHNADNEIKKRHVIMDGSNICTKKVADQKYFDCKRMQIVVDSLNEIGAKLKVKVITRIVLPAFRHFENVAPSNDRPPTMNYHILKKYEDKEMIVYPAAGQDDDKCILTFAMLHNGLIVSNDKFEDKRFVEDACLRNYYSKNLVTFTFMDDKVMLEPCPHFSRQEISLSDFLLNDIRPQIKSNNNISNNNTPLEETRSQRMSVRDSFTPQNEFEFMIRKSNKSICNRMDFYVAKSSGCIIAIHVFNSELKKISHAFGCSRPEQISEMKSVFLDEFTLIEKVTVICGIDAISRIELDVKNRLKLVTLKIGRGKIEKEGDHESKKEIKINDNQTVSGFFGSFNSNEQMNSFGVIFENFQTKLNSQLNIPTTEGEAAIRVENSIRPRARSHARQANAPVKNNSGDSGPRKIIKNRAASAARVNHIRAVIRIPAKLNGIIIGYKGTYINELKKTTQCSTIQIDHSGLCELIGTSESVQKAQDQIFEMVQNTLNNIRQKLKLLLIDSNADDDLHETIIEHILNVGVGAAFEMIDWLSEEFWKQVLDDEFLFKNCGKTELERELDRVNQLFDENKVSKENFLRERFLLSLVKNKIAKKALEEFKTEIENSKILILEEKLNENEFNLN